MSLEDQSFRTSGSRSSEIVYKGGAGGVFALDDKLHERQEFPYGCKYVLCINLIYCREKVSRLLSLQL